MSNRGLLDVMSDILDSTREMALKKKNSDNVISILEKRGILMDEFDALRKSLPPSAFERDEPELRNMANEMLILDGKIMASLEAMKEIAKQDLRNSTQQNKVLNYTNKALSASGSYMDFKE